MTPDGVIEAVDVTPKCVLGLGSGLVWKTVRQTSSDFKVLKKVSTTALSKQLPFPDIEIWMPCFLNSA